MDISDTAGTRGYGRFPLSNIVPFTYRDGATFADLLYGLRDYIRETVVPGVDENMDKLASELTSALTKAEKDFNAGRADWTKRFNTFMATVEASMLPITDTAASQLIENVSSLTRHSLMDNFATSGAGYDIIILAGQSNMSGAGQPVNPNAKPDERVFQMPALGQVGNGKIIPAIEPLRHQDQPANAGVGPGLSFGISYANAHPGRKVLLVPAARSGSGFSSTSMNPAPEGYISAGGTWDLELTQDPRNFAKNMLEQTKLAYDLAGPGSRVVAFLWVQGEGDHSLGMVGYRTKLAQLVTAVRALPFVTTDLPVVVGQMSPAGIDLSLPRQEINKAHIDFQRSNPWNAFSYAPRGLNNPGDTTHFSARAQEIIGGNMFKTYQRAHKNRSGVKCVAVENLKAYRDTTGVIVTWNPPAGRVESYLVEWSADGGEWSSVGVTQKGLVDAAAHIASGYTPGFVRVTPVNSAGNGNSLLTHVTLNSLDTGERNIAGRVINTTKGLCRLRRIGNTVYLNLQLHTFAAAGTVDLGTVPAGFRPTATTTDNIRNVSADIGRFFIDSGGVMKSYASVISGTWSYVSISYNTDDVFPAVLPGEPV